MGSMIMNILEFSYYGILNYSLARSLVLTAVQMTKEFKRLGKSSYRWFQYLSAIQHNRLSNDHAAEHLFVSPYKRLVIDNRTLYMCAVHVHRAIGSRKWK